MQKEAKDCISVQNYSFEVAIIIVLSSWQLSPYHGEERSYGETIETTHFQFLNSNPMRLQCSLGFRLYNVDVFWYINLGYATEVQDTFLYAQHMHTSLRIL